MEEVDRFEARGSRRRKWKVESGKLKFFMNVKVKVNGGTMGGRRGMEVEKCESGKVRRWSEVAIVTGKQIGRAHV